MGKIKKWMDKFKKLMRDAEKDGVRIGVFLGAEMIKDNEDDKGTKVQKSKKYTKKQYTKRDRLWGKRAS